MVSQTSFFSLKKSFRRFIRWFDDPRYNRARIRLAKRKAKTLNGHTMVVMEYTTNIYGCVMRLYCFPNTEEHHFVTVLGQGINLEDGTNNNPVRVKVVFKNEADGSLWSVYKSNYPYKVGAYLWVEEVYR